MTRKAGVILSYVLMFFEVLSTLLLTPLVIRTLGASEYGVYKLSASVVSYLMLLDLGVGNSVIRFVSKYRHEKDVYNQKRYLGLSISFYGIISFAALLLGGILILLFPRMFAKGLTHSEIVLAQKLLAFTTVNTSVTLGTSVFNNVILAYERFDISKGLSIIQILLRIALTFAALKMGMGSIGIVAVNLLLTLIVRMAFVHFVIKQLCLKPIFSGFDKGFVREIVLYSAFILIQAIATQLNSSVDQILLGIIIPGSSGIIAIYSIGHQLVQYFKTLGSSMSGVLMPGVVKLVESNATPEKINQEMVRISRLSFMVLAIVSTCFLVNGRLFVTLWAGPDYVDGYWIAMLLFAIYTFTLSQAVGTQILWAMDEHKEQSLIQITVVVVNIFLTIALIKWNPLLGATIGTVISLFLGDLVTMNLVFARKIKINLLHYYRELLRGIIPCLFLSAAVGFLIRQLHIMNWVGLVFNVLGMLTVYCISMYIFGMSQYEKRLILSFFQKHQR